MKKPTAEEYGLTQEDIEHYLEQKNCVCMKSPGIPTNAMAKVYFMDLNCERKVEKYRFIPAIRKNF